MEENFSMELWKEDFWYGMEQNYPYGIWKTRLPYHALHTGKQKITTLAHVKT